MSLTSPALAGRFFTTSTTWEAAYHEGQAKDIAFKVNRQKQILSYDQKMKIIILGNYLAFIFVATSHQWLTIPRICQLTFFWAIHLKWLHSVTSSSTMFMSQASRCLLVIWLHRSPFPESILFSLSAAVQRHWLPSRTHPCSHTKGKSECMVSRGPRASFNTNFTKQGIDSVCLRPGGTLFMERLLE